METQTKRQTAPTTNRQPAWRKKLVAQLDMLDVRIARVEIRLQEIEEQLNPGDGK